MFITETHLHTSEVSFCGAIRSNEMIKIYKDAGYSTVCITDHFMSRFFESLVDIPWEDKVTAFMTGYYRAKKAGDDLGVNVIFAPEFHLKSSPNDYIVFGLEREFLNAHPELIHMTIEEFYPLARENGLFVVQAHPHRDGVCYPTPDYVDALEAYNSNPRHNDFSDKTAELAKARNLPVTAGSDAHRPEDVARAGLISENEIKTSEELVELIKSGKAKIYKREETL